MPSRSTLRLERHAVVDGRQPVAARAHRHRAGQRRRYGHARHRCSWPKPSGCRRVSLNSTYSRIAYPDNLLPSFDRANWTVGVSMNVPILTGGRQRGDELVARSELDQSRLQQKQIEELAALDTRSAWAELLAARAAWESTGGNGPAGGSRLRDRRRSVWRRVSRRSSNCQTRGCSGSRRGRIARVAARDLQVARARVALLPDLPIGNALPATGGNPIIQQPASSGTRSTSSSRAARAVQECVRTIHAATGRHSMSTRWSLGIASFEPGRLFGLLQSKRRRRKRRARAARGSDWSGERRLGRIGHRSSSVRSSPAN